ncbi:MAG TPA: VCBS repeat-containing protein [Candidatus Acidoferrum sp.]
MKRGRKTIRCFGKSALFIVLVCLVGCGGSSGGGGQQSSPDFSLSLSSNSLSLTGGTSAPVTVSVNGTNGFASAVTLQISGLPTGVTYSPSTPQVNPGSPVQVTITAAAGSAASQENVTVTGISGNLSHAAPLNLTVTASSNASAPVLYQVSPSSVMVGVSQAILQLAGMNFTSSSIVLFDGAPANTTMGSSTAIEVILDSSIFGIAKLHTVQVSDPTNGNSNVLTYDVYSPQVGPLPFVGQQTLPLDQSATDTATLVDVNGDGRSDLVTFDTAYGTNSAQMSIRFGQQDGTLSGPVVNNVPLAYGIPAQVLAGDLTVSGHIDLILIYSTTSQVKDSYQVLLNDGSANFTAAGSGTLPGGNWGRGAVGDFNGDGKLDFVIDTGGLPPLAVLFGNGDGTFGTPVQLGSGVNKAARVQAVDLNGDGITDIVYATYTLDSSDNLDMHTLLFHPGGTSTDNLTVGVTGPSWSFVVGDFNNDRIPDLFVVDAGGTGQAYLGKGDGTFAAGGNPIAASDGFLVTPPFVAGDFDHDGNMDIVTRLTTVGPDVLLVMWGDGHANFSSQIIASDNSFKLSTGDVNGDSIPDILASDGFGYVAVTLGRNDRNFPSSKLLLNAPSGALSSGNVFNDGYHDILVSGTGDCITVAGTPGTIYHIQPDGAPIAKGTAPACPSVLVDLDGDGIADLVGISQNVIYIWKGDGTGMFQGPVAEIPGISSQSIQDLVFRDMDGDGHTDIVVSGAILYGMGNLQFSSVLLQVAPNQRFLVGDFDGDGIPDIVTPGGVLFGRGNRSFTAAMGSVPACWSGYLQSPVVGDLNGDGKDDIVCGTTSAASVEIYSGAGRSGFTQNQELAIPGISTVNTVSIGDFNGDGRLDLAVGTLGGDDVVLFTNNGNGEYQISSYAIGVSPVQSIVGDFNNDGTPDLAFVNYGYDYKPPAVEVLLHK